MFNSMTERAFLSGILGAALLACTETNDPGPTQSGSGGATGGYQDNGAGGTGGATVSGGSGGVASTGGATTTGVGGTGGAAISGGSGGESATGGAAMIGVGGTIDDATGGASGSTGGAPGGPFSVLESPGCGQGPPDPNAIGDASDAYSVATFPPGEGEIERTYYVELPEDYDNNTPYQVVYTGRGCGGNDGRTGIWHYNDEAPIVQVYLEAEPGTNGNNCFDTGGNDSIEFDYFERVHEEVRQSLCIDEHRVFASGSSSGSWLSNSLACRYAGDIIRGTATHTGGLPGGDCNGKPFAGLWLHDIDDPSNNYSGTVNAIERAIEVNGCNTTFDAERDPYVVEGATGNQTDSCEMFRGCPEEYPIVLCTLNGTEHGDTQSALMRPAFFQLLGGL